MPIPIIDSFKLDSNQPVDDRQVVADLTARDAIPAFRRFIGLSVYVLSEEKNFQLRGGIDNANWVEVTSGSSSGLMPESATCWHDESIIVTGNPLNVLVNSLGRFNMFAYQDPPANGDEFKQRIVLNSGTYTFHVLGPVGNQRGKIDWYLDTTLIVSGQDWYDPLTIWNVIKSQTGVVVSIPGVYSLRGKINGKNPSSTGALEYSMALTKFWFTKT